MEQHLTQYRIFYEVAKTGNISKAAKELFISQPAISKSISKLEGSLGIPLFIRNSRGVQLTAEGKTLFEHVSTAFDVLNKGEQEIKRIKDLNMGHIRIGVSNTLCKFVLLPYLKKFISLYPHIDIAIECQSSSHTQLMLEQQRLDIGLIAEPAGGKNLCFLPVMEIEDIFITTPQYLDHLRQREGADVDVLESGNFLLLDSTNLTRHFIDEYLRDNGLVFNHTLEISNMDLLIEFVRIGLGIGCVIKEFIQADLDQGTLIQVSLGTQIHQRMVGFAHPPNVESKALTTFINFFHHRPPSALEGDS